MTTGPSLRTLMVRIRDRERDIATGYKTRGSVDGGRFDDAPWRSGELACDCVRGRIVYGGGAFPCGGTRFRVEEVFDWETGEALRVDPGAEDARRPPPPGHARAAEAG